MECTGSKLISDGFPDIRRRKHLKPSGILAELHHEVLVWTDEYAEYYIVCIPPAVFVQDLRPFLSFNLLLTGMYGEIPQKPGLCR